MRSSLLLAGVLLLSTSLGEKVAAGVRMDVMQSEQQNLHVGVPSQASKAVGAALETVGPENAGQLSGCY